MTGLAGAGQEEMAQILAGESVATSGRMTYEGQAYRPVHPAQAQKIGVVAVPADRRKRGLIGALGLGRNLVFQAT
jgi:ABC-type sugar transport system ATPase subunit